MKVTIKTLANKAAGDIELNTSVFGLEVRKDILHKAVEWQRAKKQAGTHKTKVISEIRGTTAKPFRQKGTGNARQGSRRAVQMRGGAVAFGPVVRSHAHTLTKKVRKLALKTALSFKQANGQLIVIDNAELKAPKTSDLQKQVRALGVDSSLLVIDADAVNENLKRASSNIPGMDVLPQIGANVLDILKHKHLILTKAAVESLQERLKDDK